MGGVERGMGGVVVEIRSSINRVVDMKRVICRAPGHLLFPHSHSTEHRVSQQWASRWSLTLSRKHNSKADHVYETERLSGVFSWEAGYEL